MKRNKSVKDWVVGSTVNLNNNDGLIWERLIPVYGINRRANR